MTRRRNNNNKVTSADNIVPFSNRKRVGTADGLVNCITGMGTSLDKRSFYRYKEVQPLQMQDLNNMYRQSWISKRIVNIIPHDMTRKWREFSLDSPRKIKKIQDYEKKLQLKNKLVQAMIWGRLYGGAVIVMITDDMDFNDPESCASPLDLTKIGKDSLKSLMVFDRWRIYPTAELVSDITSPDFEQPIYYHITSNPGITVGTPRIHYSRILRFDGELVPYYVFTANGRWHDSVLQHVYDTVINNESCSQSIATMMSEANLDVYQYSGLRETLSETDDGEELIAQRIKITNLSKSVSNAIVLDAEDKYDKKQNQFTNLDNILLQNNISVCGAATVPMSILFGQSATGLNNSGESDETKHYDNVQFQQEFNLRPIFDKLDQVLIPSALGQVPEDYSFKFPSLWQESDVNRAELDFNNAKRDEIYLLNGVVSPEDVADKILLNNVYNKITKPKPEDIVGLQQNNADPQEKSSSTVNKSKNNNNKNAKTNNTK